MRRRANWIGNTGYGIGGDGTPLSEQVMLYLSEELTEGSEGAIGLALRRAKHRYYTSLPEDAFDFNDEKVMGEVVLYGLPMYRLRTAAHRPEAPVLGSDSPAPLVYGGAAAESCPSSQQRTYGPQVAEVTTTIGSYYEAVNVGLDAGTWSRLDEPIQPRLVEEVGPSVRGVVFEGGTYVTHAGFDPVVTQLGHSDVDLGEETALTGSEWLPSRLVALGQLETLAGYQKTVVVVPGQYRGKDGQERVYGAVDVTVYSSTEDDWQSPEITGVTHTVSGSSVEVVVSATDDAGVCRVVVAYTDGEGTWESVNLAESGRDTWEGTFQATGAVEYLVQVVDEGGNVTVDDNARRYYQAGREGHRIYLPVVVRAGTATAKARTQDSSQRTPQLGGGFASDLHEFRALVCTPVFLPTLDRYP
jgi:hypothetical protein